MDVYEQLGVRRALNASGFRTPAGGSLMPPQVLQAMEEAAKQYVDMNELQDRAGERVAALTHNEGAYISHGASAGMQIATAACMTRGDLKEISRLPNTEKNEIIIHRNHRNPYELVLAGVGAKLVDFGFVNQSAAYELEAAFSPRTAAVFYFQFRGGHKITEGCLPIEEVIEIARSRDVPVVLDAASQIPPLESLWRYTQMGVDLAIFSGGKALRGPQGAGLVLGRKDLIEACKIVGPPNYTILRALKVSKEDIVGMVAAVEWALGQDEGALLKKHEATVRTILSTIDGIPGTVIERVFPAESGQPVPLAVLRFIGGGAMNQQRRAIAMLKGRSPSVFVRAHELDGIVMNPLAVESSDEAEQIALSVREVASQLVEPTF